MTSASDNDSIVISILLGALDELSDRDYQQRVWISGEKNRISSLNEATAALFNDSGLDAALDRDKVTFSAHIDDQLLDLRTKLQACLRQQERYGIQEIFNSQELDRIRQIAFQLKEALSAET